MSQNSLRRSYDNKAEKVSACGSGKTNNSVEGIDADKDSCISDGSYISPLVGMDSEYENFADNESSNSQFFFIDVKKQPEQSASTSDIPLYTSFAAIKASFVSEPVNNEIPTKKATSSHITAIDDTSSNGSEKLINEGSNKSRLDVNRGGPSRKRRRYYTKDSMKKLKNSDQTGEPESETDFRIKLSKNPNDIELWKQFILAQSKLLNIKNLESTILVERQILIIEQALEENITNYDLIDMWCTYNLKIKSVAQTSKDFMRYVTEAPQKFYYWKCLTEMNQYSMNQCSYTKVIQYYMDMMTSFRTLELNNRMCTLRRACLYLRQSGHWPQMISILQLILNLHLDQRIDFTYNTSSLQSTDTLIDLEETILESGLPLGEMWYRIECLRDSYKWTGIDQDGYAETIASLSPYFQQSNITFHLAATILLMFKVPILPFRHSSLNTAGLLDIDWAFDCPEDLTSALLMPVTYKDHTLLEELCRNLMTLPCEGPQYIGPRPFAPAYKHYIQGMFMLFGQTLQNPRDKIAIYIWWLRFERLMFLFDKRSGLGSPRLTKNTRSNLKQVLSMPCYRYSGVIYSEYAMLQMELQDTDSVIQIFEDALSGQFFMNQAKNTNPDYCYLIRTYVEFLIKLDRIHLARNLLRMFINEVFKNNREQLENTIPLYISRCEQHCARAKEKYQTDIICNKLIRPVLSEQVLCCALWFIYLHEGEDECMVHFDNFLTKADPFTKESMYEWAATVMCYSIHNRKVFSDNLQRRIQQGVQEFPYNTKLVTVLFLVPTAWMNLKKYLNQNCFGAIMLSIYANLMTRIDEHGEDSIEVYKSRRLQILKHATLKESPTRIQKSALIWKIYLQFLHEYTTDENQIELVYKAAIDALPWNKSLYVSSARYAPKDVNTYQDLMIEKEILLQAQPEELNILRS